MRYIALGATWLLIAATWAVFAPARTGGEKPSAIVEEWSDLFALCRIAVENAAPLDTQGMTQVPRPDELYPSAQEWRANAWQKPGSKLIIVEREIGPVDAIMRSCEVGLADKMTTFTKRTQADMVFAYLDLRTRLVGQETHELRDIPGLSPNFGFGFGPFGVNSNGCEMLSFVYVSTELGSVVAKTAEVAPPSCVGPSYVPES